MATYLVTGGAGFIGSHLVDSLLADGHAVRVVDDLSTGSAGNLPASCELITGCVSDGAMVADAIRGVDGCFHLAAVASVDRARTHMLETHRINAGGMVTVLEAVSRRDVRIPVVYASSAAVYGNPNRVPIDENTPTGPINTYGADKLSCELHARACGVVHGIPTFGLRPFNIYGPRQNPASPYSGVISIFLDRALRGLDLTIFGDGGQVRDFVHVTDAVAAFRAAMDHATTDAPVANICTGVGTGIVDLARMAQAVARKKGVKDGAIVHAQARAGDIRTSVGVNTRAKALLGWHPRTAIDAGFASLAASLEIHP